MYENLIFYISPRWRRRVTIGVADTVIPNYSLRSDILYTKNRIDHNRPPQDAHDMFLNNLVKRVPVDDDTLKDLGTIDKYFRYENICVSSSPNRHRVYLSSINIWVTIMPLLRNRNLYTKINSLSVDQDAREDSFALQTNVLAIASPAHLLGTNFRNENPASDI